MGRLCINSKVEITALSYLKHSQEIIYTILVDGDERQLTGTMHDDPNIRGVGYSDELDKFIMSIMPFDRKISKKLFSLSWAYVDGKDINFPITLLPPNADLLTNF